MLFRDRREAGRLLADRLSRYADRDDVTVLGLPRGGVPVAAEVAAALHAPLDVVLVRKLGTPGQEELAMGAIASGGVRVLNPDVVRALGIPERAIEAAARREGLELERRERAYRAEAAPLALGGHVAIVVDDGLATGSTMRAVVGALRARKPAGIVVAVPVAARDTCMDLQREVDELVCLKTPEPFLAVGHWYADFSETSDQEIRRLLEEARRRPRGRAGAHPRSARA